MEKREKGKRERRKTGKRGRKKKGGKGDGVKPPIEFEYSKTSCEQSEPALRKR